MSNESESKTKRHRRLLTREEHALWEAVAKTAKPLRKKKTPNKPVNNVSHTDPIVIREAPPPSPRKKVAPAAPQPKPKLPQAPTLPLSSLGRRERSRIAKGRTDIDARLDLHGLTQSEAHGRLLDFLQSMQSRGATVVLVITGKGRLGSTSERGVLRRQVPQWLGLPEFRLCVSGFEEAHIGHGGEGALYVRIRKARSLLRE
jgi:DNA-nicking Smr family endonuclease